jgi:hypothetical protein
MGENLNVFFPVSSFFGNTKMGKRKIFSLCSFEGEEEELKLNKFASFSIEKGERKFSPSLQGR